MCFIHVFDLGLGQRSECLPCGDGVLVIHQLAVRDSSEEVSTKLVPPLVVGVPILEDLLCVLVMSLLDHVLCLLQDFDHDRLVV